MEHPGHSSKSSKYCLVPECTNTSYRTSKKIFISLPTGPKQMNRRNLWLKAMRRNETDISKQTKGYVCEDHFNFEEDMANFVKWKLMGGKIFLKESVVPHIFKYQEDGKRSLPSVERENSPRRKHHVECSSVPTFPDCNRSMENSGHLETKTIEPQSKNDPDMQDCVDTKDEMEIKVQNFEEVYIKEEPLEIVDSDGQDDNHYNIKEEKSVDHGMYTISNSVKTILECELCDKLFTAKCGLTQHMKSHTNEKKKFECNVCHKEFVYKSMLKNHIDIHNKKKKWKCVKCNELFKTQRYLQKHMKYHDDPTEFRCNLCNKKLLNKYSLKGHMVSHSAVKNFRCPTCYKSFSRQLTLTRHLKLHIQTEEFHCALCDRSFTKKGYIQQHMKLVHYSTENKIETKDSTTVEEKPRDSQTSEQLVLEVFKEEVCSDSEK